MGRWVLGFRRAAMVGTAVAAMLAAGPASGQGTWEQPVAGVEEPVFRGVRGLGVMIVAPQTDATTAQVEALLRAQLVASGLAELVMDDAPLGDIAAASDDELLAAARKYPVDVVVLLRTFAGADGDATAVLRIESTGDGSSQSFRFGASSAPPWHIERPAAAPVEARATAAVVPDENAAVGIADARAVVPTHGGRAPLVLDREARSPLVRDAAGNRVPWPRAYEQMGREDLAVRFERRRTTRTALVATGALLAVAGVGTLFVGLASQANCAGSESGCGRPTMIFAGGASAGLGLIGILTGVMLRPHVIGMAEMEALVRAHNEGE